MQIRGMLTRREFARIAAMGSLSLAAIDAERRVVYAGTRATAQKLNVDGSESLKAHAAAAGLQVGCAVIPELLDLTPASTDPYTHTVTQQASILVAENSMKWSSLRPSPTTFDFASGDRLVDFAQRSGQLVRGHNLCWHEQLPAWFAAAATKENARTLLTQHILTVAGRYAGRMQSWDVVNEAVHPPDGLRKSPWLDLLGPEYIEIAFTSAAQADPQAKLTYNDFDIELDTPEQAAKRGQVLLLLRRLHARKIPIHAVGIQSHLQAAGPRPGAGLQSFIREVAKMGLEVYLTEMDVNTHTLPGAPEAQDAAVAEVYSRYLSLVLPEPNVKAVLTWGITDAHTWLNQSRQPWALRPDGARQRPLPFDDNYLPTPAFFAMRSAFDTGRQPVVSPDTSAQPGNAANPVNPTNPANSVDPKDPYAPFTVPGSPGTAPGIQPPPTPPKPQMH
jgi:endo-1,4-beta-xylanase